MNDHQRQDPLSIDNLGLVLNAGFSNFSASLKPVKFFRCCQLQHMFAIATHFFTTGCKWLTRV